MTVLHLQQERATSYRNVSEGNTEPNPRGHSLVGPIARRRQICRLHQDLERLVRHVRRSGSVNQSSIVVREVTTIALFESVHGTGNQILVGAVDGQTPEANGTDRWAAGEGEEEALVCAKRVGGEGRALVARVDDLVLLQLLVTCRCYIGAFGVVS